VFVLKDFNFALGCQKAYIEPSFKDMLKKRVIILKCALENASFLGVEEKFSQNTERILLFDKDLTSLLAKLRTLLYDNIYATLLIYENRVEFSSYEATSRDVLIRASGSITETGELDIKAKAFFSPRIINELPEGLSGILTEEADGWYSYTLHVEKGEEKPFLKLDSDRFRFDFENIELK